MPLPRVAADILAHTHVPGAANCRTRHSSGLAIASTTSSSGLSGRLAASLNDVSARCAPCQPGRTHQSCVVTVGDIATFDDAYLWLQGPFFNTLYTDAPFTGASTQSHQGYIHGVTKVGRG